MSKYFIGPTNTYLVKIEGRENDYIVIGTGSLYSELSFKVGTILTLDPHEVLPATGELNSKWDKHDYPRLCRAVNGAPGGQYTVLFTSFNTGVIISVEKNCTRHIGEYSNCWIPASDTAVWEACDTLNIKFVNTKLKNTLITTVNEPDPPKRSFPLFALGYVPSSPKQTFVVMFTDETSGTVVQSPAPFGTAYGPLSQLKNLKLSNFTVMPLGTTITFSLG